MNLSNQLLLGVSLLVSILVTLSACTHKDEDGSDPYQADTGTYVRTISDSKVERVLVYQSYSNMFFETYRVFSNDDSGVEHADLSEGAASIECPVSIQGHAKSYDSRLFTLYVIAVSAVGHERLSDECRAFVDNASLRYQKLWIAGAPLELTIDRSLFKKL